MKSNMNLEEHEAMKKKRTGNLKTREESKYNYDDDLSLLISKKKKNILKIKTTFSGIIIKTTNMTTKKIFMSLYKKIVTCIYMNFRIKRDTLIVIRYPFNFICL